MSRKKNLSESNSFSNRIKNFIAKDSIRVSLGIVIIFFSIYLLISLISFLISGHIDQSVTDSVNASIDNIKNEGGSLGVKLADTLINRWIGISVLLFCPLLLLSGIKCIGKGDKKININLTKLFIYTCCSAIVISLTLGFLFIDGYKDSSIYLGGMHGYYLSNLLETNIGWSGTLLLIIALILILLVCAFSATSDIIRKFFSFEFLKKKITPEESNEPSPLTKSESEPNESSFTFGEKSPEDENNNDNNCVIDNIDTDIDINEENNNLTEEDTTDNAIDDVEFTVNVGKQEELTKKNIADLGEYDPKLDLAHYKMPSFDLLNKLDEKDLPIDNEEQNANKQRIIETLGNYGIKISSISATVGPTVTLYEIVPEAGVRISKIRNLEDDIALSLSALGIRIIAPIPGKGTIGIEVPNKDAKIVSMHSVIASRKFQESKYELPVALGKTISNEVFMIDLAKMPHVLVAGATGQGKSVGLNAIITSLLYKKHPSQLKLVLIDPKKVEFNIYSDIEKHFLAKNPESEDAIITDIPKVVNTLKSLTKEMDNRYTLLQKAHARNIKEYNAKFISRQLSPLNGHYYMPYIVVIVDEFGDLIMTAGKEVELPIARIAQLARAVGIHMIIATQRPSTNIITGVIKANFPARIAFKVSAMVDSRTILDCPGANQLIGRGDMLFSQGSELVRVQCAFVDTPEVEDICSFIGDQQGYPEAYELPEYNEDSSDSSTNDVNLKDRDELFEEAARLVVSEQQGSTSLIQRKFSLGYNRAGRIMDQLEAAGIVGPSKGSKPRDVLMMDLMALDNLLDNLN